MLKNYRPKSDPDPEAEKGLWPKREDVSGVFSFWSLIGGRGVLGLIFLVCYLSASSVFVHVVWMFL